MSNAPSMRAFRCWTAKSVGETVYSDIGALVESADALFLAAHSPMDLEHRKGAEFVVGGSGESKVLEALTSRIGDVDGNTLVAVTGGSGSGKSHVVRWVRAHLREDPSKFKILYVPRAIQTLRELLRRIIEGLPGVEGTDLMQRVDSAISNVKPGEFQDRLVSEMKLALKWRIDDFIAEDGETPDEANAREDRNGMLGVRAEDGGRKDGLADLMELPAFSETLLRPEGHLRLLVESYFSETSRRDDNEEIFTLDDLPLRSRGVLTELRSNRELKELWQIISRNPDDAIRLLEEALRMALPKATGLRGLGGDTLESLFLKSREVLRDQRQELVLIFEDLAQFGLVDGELYDQFATPPGEDLAPLRVLFAITDGAYARMPRTVRTRITHDFHVGDSALTKPADFVGRYLNLVRVGRDRTEHLWNEHSGGDIDGAWMLNACETREQGLPCRFRDECHRYFGTVEIDGLGEVGLYPYNRTALNRALARLGESPTPREVLDECLSTILAEADGRIAQGTYPHDRTRDQFDFKVRMAKDALLELNPSSDPERMYRALVIWGDESPLPAGIQDAFSLDGHRAGDPPVPPPLPPPPGPEPAQKENLLLPLFQWQNGEELPEDETNLLRDALCALTVDRLQLDQSRIHVYSGRGKALLDSMFNKTSFVIEGNRGAKAGADSMRFNLDRTAEDTRVMAAARWFIDHGHFDPGIGKWQWPEGYDPQQLMVELESRLDSWADEVRRAFLKLTGGSRLAQYALGIRAVALSAIGTPLADAPTVQSILSAPNLHGANPSPSWQEVDTVAWQIIRSTSATDYVGEFTAVRQGDSGEPQLLDPRGLEEAIRSFLASPEATLRDVVTSKSDPVLVNQARQLLDALSSSISAEAERASANAAQLSEMLEGHSLGDVSTAAFAVGDFAKNNSGFFRPSDQWTKFRDAVDLLAMNAGFEVPNLENDVAQIVGSQGSIRQLRRLCEAVTFVKSAMQLTKSECERSGGTSGDLSTLRSKVKSQLDELAALVASVEGEG
jgi:hypothetical protein